MSTREFDALRVIALSGGVGGARLVDGLRSCLAAQNLLVIANTGDDFEHLGLPICPDLDTVMYTLAGLSDPQQGWGRSDESWNCMDNLRVLGAESWFQLGDRDLATHLRRAQLLREGATLSEVTRSLCDSLGIAQQLLPMCDEPLHTIVATPSGEMAFQHYFVREQCAPRVTGFRFDGAEHARPAPGIEQFCDQGPVNAVILCPSNPYVSIDPILAVPQMRELLAGLNCPVLAVSPIIAGRAIKGPAAKMLDEVGPGSSSAAVAAHYQGLVDLFVLDSRDQDEQAAIERLGFRTLATDILIKAPAARLHLARTLLRALDDR